MEDLWFNPDAAFTQWATAKGLLHEPFVVVDVGVQGGASERWNLLGDCLTLHGFDAIEEAIRSLTRTNVKRSNHYFHNYAIGETDGERTFYFNPLNPTASSMLAQGGTRFAEKLPEQSRTVAVRRLDTLFGEGVIPRADFLKVDVEGFEKQVFAGARCFIAAGVLGIETESNFNVSPSYPKSHFSAISEILSEHGFTVFDLGFNRIPRASFGRALRLAGITADAAARDVGRPATLNLLFCRDLINERDFPQNYLKSPATVGIDQIIKMMIICELHGLNDIAVDTAERFAEALGARFDVEQAIGLLANPDCRPCSDPFRLYALVQQLKAMQRSTSWRITAPLRATKNFFARRR